MTLFPQFAAEWPVFANQVAQPPSAKVSAFYVPPSGKVSAFYVPPSHHQQQSQLNNFAGGAANLPVFGSAAPMCGGQHQYNNNNNCDSGSQQDNFTRASLFLASFCLFLINPFVMVNWNGDNADASQGPDCKSFAPLA